MGVGAFLDLARLAGGECDSTEADRENESGLDGAGDDDISRLTTMVKVLRLVDWPNEN